MKCNARELRKLIRIISFVISLFLTFFPLPLITLTTEILVTLLTTFLRLRTPGNNADKWHITTMLVTK